MIIDILYWYLFFYIYSDISFRTTDGFLNFQCVNSCIATIFSFNIFSIRDYFFTDNWGKWDTEIYRYIDKYKDIYRYRYIEIYPSAVKKFEKSSRESFPGWSLRNSWAPQYTLESYMIGFNFVFSLSKISWKFRIKFNHVLNHPVISFHFSFDSGFYCLHLPFFVVLFFLLLLHSFSQTVKVKKWYKTCFSIVQVEKSNQRMETSYRYRMHEHAGVSQVAQW